MRVYDNISNLDFALGKSGILLSLMKYCTIFDDKKLANFIKNNINDAYSLLESEDNGDIYSNNFAHGRSGAAYVLKAYTDIFGDSRYQNHLQKNNMKQWELVFAMV
ncbi:lantibiotic modifying enzyme [Streptococcus pneumoniae]|nr:lantibiotic modifying enzyme [Streptococcus pneumoniae]